MDIVYLVKNDEKNNSEELRYSLRSLKYIPHDKVVIVGEKPDWVKNVLYIPVNQNLRKGLNVIQNLLSAARSGNVSDNFVMMNDDFFFMKPIESVPTLHFGLIRDVIETYHMRYPEGSGYISNLVAQYDQLINIGIDSPVSYELHVPIVLNKQKVCDMFTQFDQDLPRQFRTFYGNYFKLGGEQIPDVKVFINPQHNDPLYNENPLAYLENQTFLSVTRGSFKRGLAGEFIHRKFSEKSEYEV